MQFITEEEPDLTLPEDSIHRARLEDVKQRVIEWTDRKTGEAKSRAMLEWWWTVTSTALGPQYIGRRVRGECEAKMTNREKNKLRIWAEALLGRDLGVGEGIDTDDLIGLEAEIVIGHRPDKNDRDKVWEFVSDLAPVSGGSYANEPPF